MDWQERYKTTSLPTQSKPTFRTIGEYQAYQDQMRGQQPTEAPKKKGFLLDQISTAGGIIGGIGGSLLAPIAGTAAGAGAGSALGEALENLIMGENVGKNVLKEGALGAVFGAGPVKLLKGAGAGAKALATGAGMAGAKQAASKATATTLLKGAGSKATSAGAGIVSDVLGIKTGAKIAGKGILKPQYIDDLGNLVMKQVKPGTAFNAAKALTATQNYADDIGSQLSKRITQSTATISGKDLSKTVVNNLQNELIEVNHPFVKRVLGRLKTAKTPEDIWKLKKIADDKISWVANPDTGISEMNAVAHSIRETLGKALTGSVKGISTLNKNYSLANDAVKLIQPNALRPKGLRIAGLNIGGPQAQSIQTGGGQLLSGVGELAGRIPSLSDTAGIAARIGGVGALRGLQGQEDYLNQNPNSVDNMFNMTNASQSSINQPMSVNNMGSQYTQQAQMSSPYSREALMYDMQRDPANAAKYIQYYQQIESIFGGGQPEQKEYSSVIAGNISDFNSSLSELNNLTQAISEGKGTTDPIIGRLRALNPYDTEQQTLQAAIDKTRQLVGKALEGGVLRKEDEEKYKKILPTVADTKTVALNKIAAIQRQLQAKLQDYSSMVGAGGTQGSSMEDILMQLQSGGY